jgi:DnaK suppressor protein
MTASRALTKKQLHQLEAELIAERARLERSLDIQKGVETATFGGPSRVPASEEGGVALALATRSHAQYAAIVNALDRLAAGTYGACAGCSSPIPFGRLLVMPEATACVTCGPRFTSGYS